MLIREMSVNVVTCIISCIGSGIFWNGFFEMPEEYIMVDHVVDRSLERAVTLWRYVELRMFLLVRFA